MRKQIQLAAVTAAVTAAFAGPALAATPIYGAGASAVQKSILFIILKDYCSSASTITYIDNGSAPTASTVTPGGSIFRLQCTPTTGAKFTSGLDITYDSAGGSWKALTATTPALLTAAQSTANANPVSTVTPGTGHTYGTLTPTILGSTFTVQYVYGATVASLGTLTSSSVTFGLTDVEALMFADTSVNQPLVNGSWNTGASSIYSGITPGTELSGFPVPAFGVVFGIAASPALYKAMQADQVAAGLLASSCTAVGATSAAAACAPFISKSQYASLVSANFGALNTNAAALFTNITPADVSIEIARRDQGSGTQAASNAYFLNQGCASGSTEASDLLPALPTDLGVVPSTSGVANPNVFQVSYNASTGNVITRLGPVGSNSASPGVTSGFAIGVVSGEKDGALSGAGFLRLDGFYPSNTNASNGVYNFVSTENLHANPNATGDGLTFIKDLGGVGTAPANEVITNYSGTGIVNLLNAATPGSAGYWNNATLCGGWRKI